LAPGSFNPSSQLFFWLGDTGWLLFKKLNREDAEKYMEDRKQKGFNVIQVMVIHNIKDAINIYGDSAIINRNVAMLNTTDGNNFDDEQEYDFWDHVDYIIDLASEKGLYMALVPIWGSNVKNGYVSKEEAKEYASFLANRYKNKKNIIWLNGGDVIASDSIDTWKIIGKTLNEIDTNHFITFHPRGRMLSTDWFHQEEWLDFNMYQSGHRRYDQDDTERCFGEDNWRYTELNYNLEPIKPTIDGEPSYEHIPQGLHDTLQPYWNENDARRYAYWSVFAGAFGHTYGHSSIMQFYRPGDKDRNYAPKKSWDEGLNDPGAKQMIHLKNLMLSRPYFERIPDQSLIADEQGEKYDYLIATRGSIYAFIYNYTGKKMLVQLGIINGKNIKASWFNPRNGNISLIDTFENKGVMEFDPPGDKKDGNDWVLILDAV
ncbi:glycoside hydrolase family 140 protein, partial [Bacteroidota bacterium]